MYNGQASGTRIIGPAGLTRIVLCKLLRRSRCGQGPARRGNESSVVRHAECLLCREESQNQPTGTEPQPRRSVSGRVIIPGVLNAPQSMRAGMKPAGTRSEYRKIGTIPKASLAPARGCTGCRAGQEAPLSGTIPGPRDNRRAGTLLEIQYSTTTKCRGSVRRQTQI
jgi:hypothetical protein